MVTSSTAQLTCTPSTLQFGVVDLGQTETLIATLTNSGSTSVSISQVIDGNVGFTTSQLSLPLILAAGQSVDLSITFAPTVRAWNGGTIKVISNASNSTLPIWVSGMGVGSEALAITPSTVSFGQVAIGSNSSVPLVIQNVRAWSITVTGIRTAGSGFSMTGPAFPVTLAAGQSITVDATFNPQSTATVGGSLFVSGPGIVVPMTGTGTSASSQLSVAPAPLNFGDVPDGTTVTEPITLSAAGASVTISSASSNNSEFALQGVSFPLTIPAGQSVSFNVAFTPKNSGSQAGALTFASNASNSPTAESLSGIGTVTAYTVNLSWNSSADVAGYNVYRSTAANGTYAKINAILDANNAYSDSSVLAGYTYYYVATSVNSTGQESARSTPPVQAAIP